MGRVLFCSGITTVFRKDTEPSGPIFSTVNLGAWSMVLIWYRKFSLCSVQCITKVSSMYLFYNLGGFYTVLRATSTKCSKY